jgi:hypothetical protein
MRTRRREALNVKDLAEGETTEPATAFSSKARAAEAVRPRGIA